MSKKDFTRKRSLPFAMLMRFMLRMVKGSTQNELERFYEIMGMPKEVVTQQAFSLARQNIKWEAFQELHAETVIGLYKEFEADLWNGYRVWAIDGSKIALPASRELLEYFGGMGPNGNVPTAQSSILYDVYNHVIADGQFEPLNIDERTLAKRHIKKLCTFSDFGKELILFDRGYPCEDLIKTLESRRISYVMRVRRKYNVDVDKLPIGVADISLSNSNDDKNNTVRVVKFLLESGEIETLFTNIKDDSLTLDKYRELYFKRWGIETRYDVLKNKFELENFSGRIVHNIRQDYWIILFLSNIACEMYWNAQEKVDEYQRGTKNKYQYVVNINHEIGVLKDDMIRVLLEDDSNKRLELYDNIIHKLSNRVVPIRPNRKIPRDKTPRKTKFNHNQKSNC
jgi:hypothetical protein